MGHVNLSNCLSLQIMYGLECLGFPQFFSVINEVHIPICALKRKIIGYGEKKVFCSMLFQGTLSHTCRLNDTEVGFSRRTHDAFMYSNFDSCTLRDTEGFVPGKPTLPLQGVKYSGPHDSL